MPRMVTPAGDMEVQVSKLEVIDNSIVATGKMGVWDAKIYVSPDDLKQIIKMTPIFKMIGLVLRLPFIK